MCPTQESNGIIHVHCFISPLFHYILLQCFSHFCCYDFVTCLTSHFILLHLRLRNITYFRNVWGRSSYIYFFITFYFFMIWSQNNQTWYLIVSYDSYFLLKWCTSFIWVIQNNPKDASICRYDKFLYNSTFTVTKNLPYYITCIYLLYYECPQMGIKSTLFFKKCGPVFTTAWSNIYNLWDHTPTAHIKLIAVFLKQPGYHIIEVISEYSVMNVTMLTQSKHANAGWLWGYIMHLWMYIFAIYCTL